MLLKTHKPSSTILYLMALEHREQLTNDEAVKLRNYNNGYYGEMKFVDLIKRGGGCVLWDIQLNMEGRFVQYDVIVIAGQMVFIFDVKNFSGAYRYMDGVFISQNGVCIKDFRPQLKRAHYMMKEFLRRSGFNYQVISKAILINETLTLSGFDGDQCIVFPQQLKTVVDYLNRLNATDDNHQLAQYLCTHHHHAYPGDVIRYRKLSMLTPGMRCLQCRQLMRQLEWKKKYIICHCGAHNKRSDMILSSLKELYLLKNERFTKQEALYWTGEASTSVKRVLAQHATAHGTGKATTYDFSVKRGP